MPGLPLMVTGLVVRVVSAGIRGSLELPASRALGFYAIIGAATFGGTALATTDIDPIAMLFWAAVLNGVVSVPIMAAAMMLAVSGKSRRTLTLPRWLQFLSWLATALMAVAVGAFAWTSI
jgi:Mn2+/Fe2+ NRAMP family transporter